VFLHVYLDRVIFSVVCCYVLVNFLLFVLRLVVSSSANDCLERLVSEMNYYVSSETLLRLNC